MAFLRSGLVGDLVPIVHGRNVRLRPPLASDYAQWAELRARSREHLRPWEPQWSHDELSRAAFRRRIRYYQRDLREDLGYAFFIFAADNDDLLGGLTLSNVRRGITQAAAVGYWLGLPYVGHGYMTEAVRALVPFAFHELKLHRLEAACLPHNLASIRVLERNGFQREGLARRYLRINGSWQDHLLFALLSEDSQSSPSLIS
jgi:[ribosomal protein S5]-alanine N-acetyltransferase